MATAKSVRWRTLGRHISWLSGRRWKRHGWGDHPAIWVYVGRHDDGRWYVIKLGFFNLGIFIDRRQHYIPPEPNLVRRWITGRA